MAVNKGKGGGAKKYGRNAAWCKAYRASARREKNKILRLVKHLKRFPQDGKAVYVLNNLPYDKPEGWWKVVAKKSNAKRKAPRIPMRGPHTPKLITLLPKGG